MLSTSEHEYDNRTVNNEMNKTIILKNLFIVQIIKINIRLNAKANLTTKAASRVLDAVIVKNGRIKNVSNLKTEGYIPLHFALPSATKAM